MRKSKSCAEPAQTPRLRLLRLLPMEAARERAHFTARDGAPWEHTHTHTHPHGNVSAESRKQTLRLSESDWSILLNIALGTGRVLHTNI